LAAQTVPLPRLSVTFNVCHISLLLAGHGAQNIDDVGLGAVPFSVINKIVRICRVNDAFRFTLSSLALIHSRHQVRFVVLTLRYIKPVISISF
jgi:hypothetical protein